MTKIKICGITNLDDARVAAEAGADLLGFIFYKPSPRYVTPDKVKRIVASFKGASSNKPKTQDFKPLFVGVFVNTPQAEVAQILDHCRLDAAQLHGEESPAFVNHFSGRAYKALRSKSNKEATKLSRLYTADPQSSQSPISQSLIPALLLDAYHPKLYGGTGNTADWATAAKIARQHSLMLAGSLTPENVAAAIDAVQPWGVDVSSGVEAEKGRKDHGQVRGFVEAVRGHS